MTMNSIADEHGCTQSFVSQIANGIRKTPNINLAVAIARKTGRPPIEYLSEKIKDIAIEARPELAMPIKEE